MNNIALYVSMICVLANAGCGKSSPRVANDPNSASPVNITDEKAGFTLQEITTPFGESIVLPVERNKRIGMPRNIREWRDYFRYCGKYVTDDAAKIRSIGRTLDPSRGTMASSSSRRVLIGDTSDLYYSEGMMILHAIMQASKELRDGPDGIRADLREVYMYNRVGNVVFQAKVEINGWDGSYIPDPICGLKIYRLNKCIMKNLTSVRSLHRDDSLRDYTFHYYLPPELNFPEQSTYRELNASAFTASRDRANWKEVARSDLLGLIMDDIFLPSDECREYEKKRLEADTIRYLSRRNERELLPQN